MQPQKTQAIRKRTQIAKANRTMFLWIAVASAVVGAAVVVAIFLTQKLIFNERVLAEKDKTASTLRANNGVVNELKSQVRLLDTNEALMATRASESQQAVQVILDALPSSANSSALGASLQNKLLAGIPGLVIESLQVDPVVGIETLTSDNTVDASTDDAIANQITFQFTVSGSQDALKQVLTNLERSIRAIDVTSLQIESQGTSQVMTVRARAFYEPAKSVELKEKVIKP